MPRSAALALALLVLGTPAQTMPAQAMPTDALRRPEAIPFPAHNPYSDAKRDLGERLFFDPRLSGGDGLSCAGCHAPETGFADARASAVGEPGVPVGRRTPTLWNLAWAERLFWDGRAGSLEAQATGPVTAPLEMNQDLDALMVELEADAGYREAFARAFPEEPRPTPRALAAALATYERTLVSPEAPFDRWLAGDEGAMDPAAKRGFELFAGKAACTDCHEGWSFTDHAFYDIGLPASAASNPRNAWKAPTLRQLKHRAPYMHDGSLATLADVVKHYADGVVERPTLSPDTKRRIDLSAAEQADLVAFLEALDGDGQPLPMAHAAPAPRVAALPGAPRSAEVTQRDKAFSARGVALARGGALVVHNQDTREHNVRVFSEGMDYDSGLQEPGQSVTLRFDAAGTHHVYCAIHPKMKLTVEVEP